MNRKLKALGLALMAVLAMGVVVASSAQAADEFTSEGYPTSIRGSQEGLTANNYFDVTENKLHCETADFEATITGPTKELTVTSHFAGPNGSEHCITTGLNLNTTITQNGCDFRFTTHGTDPSGNVTGTADVVCPAGKQIEIHVGSICTVDVLPQTGLTGVTFTNKGTNTITVDVDITNQITTLETKPSIFCPFTNGSHTKGSFVSTATVECFVDTGTDAAAATGAIKYTGTVKRNCDVK